MARILTYDIDTVVTENDKWIGTDFSGGVTKNFTPTTVSGYLNESASIGVANQIAFKYYATFTPPRPEGSITLIGFNPNFSSLTTIKVSKKSSGKKIIVDYLNTLEGTEVIISNAKDANLFGKFYLSNIVQNVGEPDFYDLTLEFIEGHGNLTDLDVYLISFNAYVGSSDKTYIHTQSTASSTWNIVHNLNKYASVSIVDSGKNVVYGEIVYVDENNITLNFNSSFSGKAFIN